MSWRAAFLINVPLVHRSPCSRRSATCAETEGRGRAGAVRLARRGRRGRRRRRAGVRGDPRPGHATGRTRSPGSRSRSARSPSSRSRSSWPAGRTRSCRSACSGAGAFATINLSTLLIYGALYTIVYFLGLFLQNVVGYTATAAGLIGLPTGILLTLLSARVGTLGGRIGPRPFLVVGPAPHGRGPALARARSRPTTRAVAARARRPVDLHPAAVDARRHPAVRPAVRGFGFSLVVAPLTATLMSSVPVANAGARVGDQQRDQPGRAAAAVGRDLRRASRARSTRRSRRPCPASTRRIRRCGRMVQPLNPPRRQRPAERRQRREGGLGRLRSTSPSLVCGAAARGRRGGRTGSACGRARAATSGDGRARPPAGVAEAVPWLTRAGPTPHDWDGATYDRVADPMTRWGTDVLDRLPLPGRRDGARRRLRVGPGHRAAARAPAARAGSIALDASPVDGRGRPRAAGPVRRPGDVRGRGPGRAAAARPTRASTRSCRRRRFHWVARPRRAVPAPRARSLRPGGRLVAQCGGAGQHRGGPRRPRRDRRRLAGSVDVRDARGDARAARGRRASPTIETWLNDEPTPFEPGAPFREYLRTVVLGAHLERLAPDAERERSSTPSRRALPGRRRSTTCGSTSSRRAPSRRVEPLATGPERRRRGPG